MNTTQQTDTHLSTANPLCKTCAGMGYLLNPATGVIPCPDCMAPQITKQRISRLWRNGLATYETMTFASFHTRADEKLTPANRNAMNVALEAAKAYANDPRGFFVLSGGNGAGKTHLAAAIANQAVQTTSVLFKRAVDLFNDLRRGYDDNSYHRLLSSAQDVGLLVLDDLGAQNNKSWVDEQLYNLIDYRYMTGFPLVITTNLPVVEFSPRIADRLADRCKGSVITMNVTSYRSAVRTISMFG